MKKTSTFNKILIAFVVFILHQNTTAQNEFISIWQSTNTNPSIEIPTYEGEIYNYNVNWGDGSVNNNVVGDISHEYAAIGNYTVTISGLFPGINFKKIYIRDGVYNNNGILSIEQWGNNQWQTMEGAFKGQTSLVVNTIDTPDLSQSTNLDEVFFDCESLHLGTSNTWNAWDVSTIRTMKFAFYNTDFNELIENWNVSNVTNMSYLFLENESFNQPLNGWNVSNVTNMNGMFSGAIKFNQPLDNWNVTNVTNMSEMFESAEDFDQPIALWNVMSVTNMNGMFSRALSFNQPLDNWNVSNVTDMTSMFFQSENFDRIINGWDVSNVTSMSSMFMRAIKFNHHLNNWDVSNVQFMSSMFFLATNFNQPLGNWDVSSVTKMDSMFSSARNFNQSLINWDVSNVTDMSGMFNSASVFSQPLNDWEVDNVTNMGSMFNAADAFNLPLNNWNVGNVTDMGFMFSSNTIFNQPLNNWDVSNVTVMSRMFSGATVFNQDISNWNTIKVEYLNSMFANSNFNQPVNNWNLSSVLQMSEMFQNNTVFNQPLNNWNVGNVTDMHRLFSGATAFNQDISGWNTSKVIFMNGMFQNATAFDQDISAWNVEQVTTCLEMFENIKLNATNYDALLIAWSLQDLKQNVVFNAGNSQYRSSEAEIARQNMIDNNNWTIRDAGLELFIWTGNIDTDWNNPQNWSTNSVPTEDNNVVLADVANAPKINFNQSYTINNLTTAEVLTIKTNASLTVNGDLDQRANIEVESFANGNGSFILRGNQTNINPADLIYLRYVSGNNWHLFSSPVTNIDIDVFAAATALAEGQNNNRGIGFYDNNANPNWSYYQDGANGTGNFIAGKGYSLQTSAAAFLILTGKLKDTDLNNYVITENLNGWNLVGNPYPANINANVNADANENFLTENAANLDPAFANIYLWDPSTTSYEPIGNGLGAKYIAPGQGFFVKSKNGGGTIDINKSMLTHQIGNLFLKENQPQKIVLKINDNTNASETTIAFKNGMTKGLDITYDAAVFNGESRKLSLYTNLLEDGKNVPFAIQFLPELENNDFIIPLGIEKNQDQEITISLKETTLSSAVKIYLEDKLVNTFTEISKTPNYTFSHHKLANEIGRFYLHIQKNALNTENIQTNNINIYKDSESSILINGVADGMLNVYSITGKNVIENRKISENEKRIQLPNLTKGVYLFEVKTNSRKIVKKIIF